MGNSQASIFQLIISPGDYTGQYFLSTLDGGRTKAAGPFRGPSRMFLPAVARNYNWSSYHGANANFSIDGTGAAHGLACGLIGAGDQLLLQTAVIEIDPGDFAGSYHIAGVDNDRRGGRRQFVVLRGIVGDAVDQGYTLVMGPGCNIRFNVDCAGALGLNAHYANAGDCQAGLMRLNTVSIEIEPEFTTQKWRIDSIDSAWRTGASTVKLIVQGRGYALRLNPIGPVARFDLDGEGRPPSRVEVIDGEQILAFRLARVGGPA